MEVLSDIELFQILKQRKVFQKVVSFICFAISIIVIPVFKITNSN